MFFPDDDDEPIEEGDPSFTYEDTHLPPVGNTFWSTMRGIWAAIETTLKTMNNPFATDDNVSDDNISDDNISDDNISDDNISDDNINDYYIIKDADTDFVGIKAAFETKVNTETVKYDDVSRLQEDEDEDADDVQEDEDEDEDKVPEFIFATPGRIPRNNVDGSQSSQSSQYEPLTPWSQGASQVENKELFDVSAEKNEPPLTPSTSKSLMESTASSNSPPPSQYETTCDFAKASATQSICGTVATKNTVNSGVSRGTIKSKSVEQIIEEESDANKLEIQSVATTVLSNLIKTQKMNVGKLLTEGGASKVYMAIANILYQQNVAIDVRDGASRGKSNEGQMREVWGSVITDYAKSEHAQCYLCGGDIVPCKRGISAGGARQGGQPEMEHKLPCAVFYARFAFIYSCFAAELVAWRTYVANLDEGSRLMQYYILMNSNDAVFNKGKLDDMYKTISADFLESFDNKNFDETNLKLFVNYVLPAYLSEFAYSHHLCNQLKSNHDLSETDTLTNYYKGLVAILNRTGTECIINAAYNDTVKLLKPACINRDICVGERAAIMTGLFPNSKDMINNRQNNVKDQNVYLYAFARKYAEVSKTTEKRMILHTIKETIRTMKVPIPKAGNVTKKAVKQMNAQARIIAQGLQPITNEVRYFLNSMETFDPTANTRLQQKANDKLRAQLDRTHQIFENAYTAINNITSQLKNAYVDPKIKTLIHQRATEYNNILSRILGRIERNIASLNFSLEEDDVQMISECKGVVGGLNDNLNRYSKKNPEVLTVGKPVPMKEEEATGVAPVVGVEEQMGVAQPMEEEAMGVAPALGIAPPLGAAQPMEEEPLPKPPVYIKPTKRPLAPTAATFRTTNKLQPNQKRDRKEGGKKKRRNKTRKVKKHHRKPTKKSRARKFTMKYKYISKKNTRRR